MFLECTHIDKKFGNEQVIRDLTFSLERHQTLSILGKSGCGKTTMLKIIAGLIAPDAGTITLEQESIDHLPPQKRGIVYLYQEDLLFPHLTAYENIAFGLRIRKVDGKEIKSKVQDMIANLGLEGQEDKMPHQLSGGQRQRVSFGRAMIISPKLLLLDEPFGSLDAGTRAKMQEFFQSISSTYDMTSIFVTHDLKEAIMMGDQIGLMDAGQLEIYKDKETFINDPKTGVQQELQFWNKINKK